MSKDMSNQQNCLFCGVVAGRVHSQQVYADDTVVTSWTSVRRRRYTSW